MITLATGTPTRKAIGVVTRPGFVNGDTLPNRADCVFFSRGVTDTIGESSYLADISGNENHIPVVSGTTFEDLVVNVPTGHALADVGPFTADTDVTLADVTPDDNARIGPKGDVSIGVYSTLSSDVKVRADKFLRSWVDGYTDVAPYQLSSGTTVNAGTALWI